MDKSIDASCGSCIIVSYHFLFIHSFLSRLVKFSIVFWFYTSLGYSRSGPFRFLFLFCFMYIVVSYSREFTHRVKSVSMAKFSSQEVEAIQNGGNQVQHSTFFLFGNRRLAFSMLMGPSLISACKGYISKGLGPSKAAIA